MFVGDGETVLGRRGCGGAPGDKEDPSLPSRQEGTSWGQALCHPFCDIRATVCFEKQNESHLARVQAQGRTRLVRSLDRVWGQGLLPNNST